MENIKLFELIKKLTPHEFEEFGVFLNSPFLNTSEHAKSLYSFVKKYYPNLDNENLTKELIFSKLYPKEEYKDKKLRDLFSLTNELAENYLAYAEFKNDKISLKTYSLKRLGSKDLYKHFEQKSRQIETVLSNMEVKDETYFYFNNLLMSERRIYFEDMKTTGKRESIFVELGNEIEQFIYYFVSKMLYYYANQITHLMVIKHEANFQLLDELICFLNEKNLEVYPQINVLHHVVKLMRDRTNSDVLDSLEKLVNTPELKIHKGLLQDTYAVLFNCTKELSMKNIRGYDERYYGILKQMVEKNLLQVLNGYLNHNSFIQIAIEGLAHKDYEWSRNFIEQNYQKLRPELRQNLYIYTMGLLNYGLKNYDEALSLLVKVKSDDFTIYTRVKLHFIRIYFETKDYERVQSEIDAFRHHLKADKKMPDIYLKRYMTFASYIGKVITAIFADDTEKLFLILKEIKDAPVFEFRKWLIEQLELLIKSISPQKP